MASLRSHPFTPKAYGSTNLWATSGHSSILHSPPHPPAAVDYRGAPEPYPSSASVKALVLLLLPLSPFLLPSESRQETSSQFAALNFFLAAQPATPGAAAASGPEGRMGRGWAAGTGMQGSRLQGVGCEEWDERIEMRDTGM